MPLTIGVDISQIVYETGVSVYTKNLVTNLLSLDSDHKFILFGSSLRQLPKLKAFASSLLPNHTDKFYPIPPSMWEIIANRRRAIPVEFFTGPLDVFHSSDWTQPKTKALKITTIHDLAPVKFPDTHPYIKAVHQRRLKLVKQEVDWIISPSQFTRSELIDYGFDKNKIIVIPEAPDPIFRKSTLGEIKRVKSEYKITKPFFLAIGTGARKNTPNIIQAFLDSNFSQNMNMVFTGHPNQTLPTNKSLKFLGHVPTKDLPALYSSAQALIYPSFYEGFGLPILEAFACSCPVITSDIPALKELAANAALYVNPHIPQDLTHAMSTIDSKSHLLVQKYPSILKNYSWQSAAQQTLNLYEQKH